MNFMILLQLQIPSRVVSGLNSFPDQSAFISRMLPCTANNGPKYSFIRLLNYNLY